MRAVLKVLAWFFKISAMIFWFGAAWFVTGNDLISLQSPSHWRESDDWGTPAYQHRIYLEIAELITLALFAMLPNRWLIFSPAAFIVALLIAFIPFCWIATVFPRQLSEWTDLFFILPMMLIFALLPLSLILSFVRLRKGEKLIFA